MTEGVLRGKPIVRQEVRFRVDLRFDVDHIMEERRQMIEGVVPVIAERQLALRATIGYVVGSRARLVGCEYGDGFEQSCGALSKPGLVPQTKLRGMVSYASFSRRIISGAFAKRKKDVVGKLQFYTKTFLQRNSLPF